MSKIYQVIPVAYDWRRPMEEEVLRLVDAIQRALEDRLKTAQPVRILAHSSGGLLARTLQLEKPELWHELLASAGARIVMLGSPNAGCWTPMQVLSGDDTFGGTLSAGAAPFEEPRVRGVMAAFPGFMQLQARLDDAQLKLGERSTWERLAENDLRRIRDVSPWHNQPIQQDQYKWGIPSAEALDKAVTLRRRLDAQAAQVGGISEKILAVVGQAKLTPAGYVEDSEGFAYRYVPDRGDGRVTLEDAMLPSIPAWIVPGEHAQLASAKDAFPAYQQLLEHGTTTLLQRISFEESTRGISDSAASVRKRPSRIRVSSAPAEEEEQVLSTPESRSRDDSSASGRALRVSVVNGDLMFIQQPILIGHYRSMRLTGTELVMDRLVGHMMRNSLDLGQYPDVPGTHQVFMNTQRHDDPFRLPRPEAVIVVGLGEEGKLAAAGLLQTIRLGVIAWAQRMLEKPGSPAVFDISATLIGSGGKGISIAQSAQLVAQGVREADDRLASGGKTGEPGAGLRWPRVGSLQIVELYLDRATEAWAALKVLSDASPNRYVVADSVRSGNGALRRPLDSGYRGADYDFISVETRQDPNARPVIAYTLDTKRARTEVSAQRTQPPLIRNLLALSNSVADADKIGRTLFNMLVPVEIEPFLGSSTDMVLELDSSTAGIPWELLDTDSGAGQQRQPWAIRAKVVRKLKTGDFRANPADASAEASVLVIGAPKCPQGYPPLPGARNEAKAVAERFCRPGALSRNSVVTLVSESETEDGPEATTVLTTLHDRNWRIVHIAGHGAPPESDDPPDDKTSAGKLRNPRGVVLSDNTFLGAIEFGNMRVVPELVFVNCCYLAAHNAADVLSDAPKPYDRPQFAATVADALIKLGVRCVIAAGWAVDDAAAKIFATAFYDAILERKPFIDAVAEARVAARELGGNTWAAYQCYGDPDWTFRRDVADAQRPQEFPFRKFDAIASPPALKLALDALAAEIRVQQNQPDPKLKKNSTATGSVGYLQQRFGERWGGIGEVAEAFAAAWAEAGDAKAAIEWYDKAVTANDGTASIKAMEQLGNQRARLAWNEFSQSLERARREKTAPDAHRKPGLDRKELDKARAKISEALMLLQKVVDLQPSMERESLVASAYKRLAMIEAEAERVKEEASAIEEMRKHYELAINLGARAGLADRFYPALNYIVAALACNAGKPSWGGLDPKSVETVRDSLIAKVRDDPDFWSVVGQTELKMYLAMSAGKLSPEREDLEQEFKDTYERVTAINKWASVCDNAEFLLPKYAERAGDEEKRAALGLLALLRKLAQRPEPPQTAVQGQPRRRRSG